MDWLQDLDETNLHEEPSPSYVEEDNASMVMERADSLDLGPLAAVTNDETRQTSQTAISSTTFLQPK
jgi:hypothetical protein